jgi:hypothetical protein
LDLSSAINALTIHEKALRKEEMALSLAINPLRKDEIALSLAINPLRKRKWLRACP